MDERTVQAILKHKPARLVLVSCNPATLARDLALLAPAYEIRAVQPVDLFPQTPHIETVVSLLKK
jgi:23S rRNA (uracil1939-C5)-methyltransferase